MSEPDSALERALAWLKQTWYQAPPTLRRRWPWLIAAGVLVGFLLVVIVRWASSGPAQPGASQATSAAGGTGAGGAADGSDRQAPVQPPLAPSASASVDAGAPLSPNVKVTFRTFPPRRASVTWGSKRLGFIDRGKPLVIERARDSGPLDVIVRAPGFLPVHARAYTFDDATVDVKITPLDKKDSIYGYQQPLGDAGAPLAAPL
jgi:hypothetical protein